MTTKVTVDAHAGWPVHVKMIDKAASGEWQETGTETVPSNETRDFYIHDARRLEIEEGKRNDKSADLEQRANDQFGKTNPDA